MPRRANKPNNEERAFDRHQKALFKDLRRIFSESDLHAWLASPNAQLGGRTPQVMLGTLDQQHVVDLIEAVKSGAFS